MIATIIGVKDREGNRVGREALDKAAKAGLASTPGLRVSEDQVNSRLIFYPADPDHQYIASKVYTAVGLAGFRGPYTVRNIEPQRGMVWVQPGRTL